LQRTCATLRSSLAPVIGPNRPPSLPSGIGAHIGTPTADIPCNFSILFRKNAGAIFHSQPRKSRPNFSAHYLKTFLIAQTDSKA
jgi:hypothetical protein